MATALQSLRSALLLSLSLLAPIPSSADEIDGPADPPSCLAAAYLFHASPELSEFGSPVETLVPSDA